MRIRRATPGDTEVCARLILETPGGLREILGDGGVALKAAAAAFASRQTGMSHTRALVADREGAVLGHVIRFHGSEWPRLRVRTGLVMLRATGLRFGARLAWRGSAEDRLMPVVPRDCLYVGSLAVLPEERGRGVGTGLLRLVVSEARVAGLGSVALDVAVSNEAAIRLYQREGFEVTAERRLPPARGLPAMGSLRMELKV